MPPKDRAGFFLPPRDYTATQSRLSGFMTHKLHEPRRTDVPATPRPDPWGWADAIAFNPPAPESSYCLFETQDEKNPTIERIADTLLPSVEAVGKQWFTFRHVSIGTRRLFLPVIVTNATLYTCTFDAEVECRHQVPGLRQRRQRRDEGEGWQESSH